MHAFFQNLITAGFYGSIIIVAILLLRVLLKSAPKRAICLLWVLAFIRLLMPFQLQSHLSLQPEAIPLEEAPFYEAVFTPAADGETTDDGTNFTPVVNEIVQPNEGAVQSPITPQLGTVAPAEPKSSITFAELLPWLWALGAMCMLLYAFGSYIHLKLTVREAIKIIGGWECDRIETAFILGYIHPQIYVPMGLTRRTRKHILSHEWAHLRSGDHWFKLVAYLALSLHWYNPLVWVAYRLMCKDMEHACDERVVRYMNLEERKQYSHALLTCSTNRSHYTPCPVAFGEVSVKSRILSVLNYRKPSFWVTLIAVVAIVCVGVFLMTSPESADIPDTNIGNTDELFHEIEIDETVSYTAPSYPDTTEVYRVGTVNDFLDALGSNRIIELAPGTYNLWSALTYNTDHNTEAYYYWETDYSKNELVIRNVENLIIRGSGMDSTKIVSESYASDVLKFENCKRISVEGFTAGHTTQPRSCDGGVIGLANCEDVSLRGLGLYGCGAIGVAAETSERVLIADSHIYDCSSYGVTVYDTESLSVENCRVYRIGNRENTGRALMRVVDSKGIFAKNCQFNDNYLLSLIDAQNNDGLHLSLLNFEGNTVTSAALELYSNRSPIVMDKCTFRDNHIVKWYAVDMVYAVNEQGEKLTPEMLDREEEEIVPDYSPQTEVRVSNVDEFLAAIGSNTAIILEEGEYDLSTASEYGTGSGGYYYWYNHVDGPELHITGVTNMSIQGAGADKTTISAVPRHANALTFSACSNIELKDFTAGHTREPGVCSGGVLHFVASNDIDLYGLGLYGCGIYGVTTSNVEQISIANCDIYECSQGGTRMSDTNGITIKNCIFRDLGGYAMQWDMGCRGIVTEGNTLPESFDYKTDAGTAEQFIDEASLQYAGQNVTEFTIAVGQTVDLTLAYSPEDYPVTNTDVRWSSAYADVASVKGNHDFCTIKGEKAGMSIIYCEVVDQIACVTVYVRESW